MYEILGHGNDQNCLSLNSLVLLVSKLVDHLDGVRDGVSQTQDQVPANLPPGPGLQLPVLSVPGLVVVTVLPVIVGAGAVVIVILVRLFL